MNYTLLILPTIVLLAFGIILIATTTTEPMGALDVNNSMALLTIKTYQPWCTALELSQLNITRLTDVRPYYRFDEGFGYDPDDLRNGINITAIIWEQDSDITIPAMLERPEVVSIGMYTPVTQNATTSMTLTELNVNHNATWRGDSISRCGDALDTNTIQSLLDLIGLEGAKPGTGPMGLPPGNRTEPAPAGPMGASGDEPEPLTLDPVPDYAHVDVISGTYYYGDLMGVSIRTYGNAATDVWRYLKDNGAIVYRVNPHERVDRLAAYVPPSILWPLSIRDDIRKINPIGPPFQEHYGSANTEGLLSDVHPNVEQWHGLGYNGTGVSVGIVDEWFNLQTTTGNDLPPQTSITCRDGCTGVRYLGTNLAGGRAHGMGVAEIVMDMAPAAS